MIIDHLGIVISDYARSKDFYAKCLAPLGVELIVEIEGWAGFGRGDKAELWFGPDGDAHKPMHIAFVAAGGKDNGAPGLRSMYHPHYYGAFLIDPDGHNIEAVCHRPE
jgi:catechol 2,3-dioxygenase-like lactoylglutathione lyase family enzyme